MYLCNCCLYGIIIRIDMKQLHLSLTEESPVFQRALARSRTGARGHIGTHLDCYTKVPSSSHYEKDALILDCTNGMPTKERCRLLPSLKDKVLVLYTGNMEQHEYASDAYHSTKIFIEDDALRELLTHHPSFILLDSHGLGESGKIHTGMDVLCEQSGCHVIENANLLPIKGRASARLTIDIDVENKSTGKPCKVFAE